MQLSFEIATKPEFHIEFIDSHVLWCGKLLWGTNSTDGNKSVHSLFNTTHIIFFKFGSEKESTYSYCCRCVYLPTCTSKLQVSITVFAYVTKSDKSILNLHDQGLMFTFSVTRHFVSQIVDRLWCKLFIPSVPDTLHIYF